VNGDKMPDIGRAMSPVNNSFFPGDPGSGGLQLTQKFIIGVDKRGGLIHDNFYFETAGQQLFDLAQDGLGLFGNKANIEPDSTVVRDFIERGIGGGDLADIDRGLPLGGLGVREFFTKNSEKPSHFQNGIFTCPGVSAVSGLAQAGKL
jgi:hypothetical protein